LRQLAELLPAPTRPIEVVGGPSYVFESLSPAASLCSAELAARGGTQFPYAAAKEQNENA